MTWQRTLDEAALNLAVNTYAAQARFLASNGGGLARHPSGDLGGVHQATGFKAIVARRFDEVPPSEPWRGSGLQGGRRQAER